MNREPFQLVSRSVYVSTFHSKTKHEYNTQIHQIGNRAEKVRQRGAKEKRKAYKLRVRSIHRIPE